MAEREYRRLTRAKSRSLFGIVSTARSSLWLGKDHLLQIDASGYTESYKRFYFRDIQALVFCRTDHWLYRAGVFAVLASMFVLIAIFGGGAVMGWIFGILAAIFGLCLLLELLVGPSSKAYLRTAVQTEPLISLNRLRRARYVLETVRPFIIRAQAELGTTQLSAEVKRSSDQPPVINSVVDPLAGMAPQTSTPPTAESR